MTARRTSLLAASAAALVTGASHLPAQVRGAPIFFDPTYAYDTRAGIALAHGGETNGLVLAVDGSRLFYVGNCGRLAVSAAAGIWNAPGGDFGRHVNIGAGGSYLLNPCPAPLSAPNPTFRIHGGLGMTRASTQTGLHLYGGIGAGYMVDFPIARIEPWVAPRLHYRESLASSGSSDLDLAISVGITVGVGAVAGLRLAADCCKGGLGGGYGLSLWW